MWVGGWVGGSAKIPGGQFDPPPPPPVSLSKGLEGLRFGGSGPGPLLWRARGGPGGAGGLACVRAVVLRFVEGSRRRPEAGEWRRGGRGGHWGCTMKAEGGCRLVLPDVLGGTGEGAQGGAAGLMDSHKPPPPLVQATNEL